MHSNALLTEAAKMTIFNASAAVFILDFFIFLFLIIIIWYNE